MKLLVLSDAHANIWALREIIKEEKNFDSLAFAGDMVVYGIAPSQVIAWFRSAENAYLEQLPKYSCFYADGWAYLLTHQYVARKDSTVYGDL